MMEGVAAGHLCLQRGRKGCNEARQLVHSHTGESQERGRAGLQASARYIRQRVGLLASEALWTINRDKPICSPVYTPVGLLLPLNLPSPVPTPLWVNV